MLHEEFWFSTVFKKEEVSQFNRINAFLPTKLDKTFFSRASLLPRRNVLYRFGCFSSDAYFIKADNYCVHI